MKWLFPLLICISLQATEIDKLKEKQVIRFFKHHATQVLDELSIKEVIFTINQKQIDIDYLRGQLDQTLINVSQKELIDNTGSLVDVIGEPRKLTLDLNSWIDFQKSGKDLRPLIIHELLRIAGIDDDDYLISRPLYKILHLQTNNEVGKAPYCNMRVAKTRTETSKKSFSGVGYAPLGSHGSAFIIDTVSNRSEQRISYENAVKDIKEQCEKAGYYGFEHIKGHTIMQRRNSNGFIRMEKKTLITAYCFKDKIKKRRKKEIRKESCEKAKVCEETYKSAPSGQVSKELFAELSRIKGENKCD